MANELGMSNESYESAIINKIAPSLVTTGILGDLNYNIVLTSQRITEVLERAGRIFELYNENLGPFDQYDAFLI